ncbi:RNA polymerase recycling motor HelD [Salisediminibacterium beveridgei]|uniref:ATP-dependent DNA helicase rep n=1 Tax=Salisediminibacterium beveridgei TaxID=632773 RepID=A0A1D7QXQ5_9BACI|nr:RNA polymerase recycling motor HelD [Salisediminibacterium beveridgei]AOM83793.1 ATP-dependent DNA helicase rep [Salisediminibacterium beveridgei]
MKADKHPAKEEEQKRLEYTTEYIEEVLEAARQSKIDYKSKIKQALIDLDHLDSSNSYVNILANANMLDTTGKNLRMLESLKDEPYFARMDFVPEGKIEKEKLYIGKTSLTEQDSQEPVILDWRSPIANIYYEGQLGEVTYEAHGKTFHGELELKRQFVIEEKSLQEIRDIDLTARDQLLQESLTTSADNRLKDIVSTIQAEQNQIIRADMNRPLFVQGVAGSGKTTIALHRMAYFIYSYADDFDPSQLMILAPNRLFLDYISDVLPELGVDLVTQTTFTDYTKHIIGDRFTFRSKDERIAAIIDPEQFTGDIEWIAGFKGSKNMKVILDSYLEGIIDSWLPDQDITLDRYTLFTAEEIRKLYEDEYTYIAPYQRLMKIREVIKATVKRRSKELLDKVEELYDDKIDALRSRVKDEEERRQRVVKLWDKREAHLDAMRKEAKTILPQLTKQMPKTKTEALTRKLLTDKDTLIHIASEYLSESEVETFTRHHRTTFRKKELDLEDAAIFLYIESRLFGIHKEHQYQNVFIDEAQDYSYLEFVVLKQVCNTSLFTILGDLSQGIHSYRGITSWQNVMEDVFVNASFQTLRQSYRTTIEIMQEANRVIQKSSYEGMVLAEPVVRHDEQPDIHQFTAMNEAAAAIYKHYREIRGDVYHSFAIVTKTEREAERVYQEVSLASGEMSVSLLDENQEHDGTDIVILPSYLSKGLEFDVVTILTDQDAFTDQDIDIKLLYVAMTRALHRLSIWYNQKHEGLIEDVLNHKQI